MRARAALILILALVSAPTLAGLEGSTREPVGRLGQERTVLQACPEQPGTQPTLAQVQKDCCKKNKGICGCRAGKIVCCDGTFSPDCTCHSDWSAQN